MSSISTSNVTSGFIDLATFDEIEKYMYGGPDATAYFVRETRKATWFTQVPVILSRASGNAGFGQEWSAQISRAGDYLLQTWLRLGLSEVRLASTVSDLTYPGTLPTGSPTPYYTVRWTKNFMHNLVKECAITFNDLVAARFDCYHLDFWANFTVPAGKQNGYLNMIGNTSSLINPILPPSVSADSALTAHNLNLPLPLFYGRDSGVALPTAALPYNDMRINFVFAPWQDLLIGQWSDSGAYPVNSTNCLVNPNYLQHVPAINNCAVWANYAIVSNDERKRMACAPRDILIEQVQSAPRQSFLTAGNNNPSYDIRFSHAIKVLFFAAWNRTAVQIGSNYSTLEPIVYTTQSTRGTVTNTIALSIMPPAASDPILSTSLIYENTARLSNMGSDYFSLVNPYFNAPVIPLQIGYHSYSYSLDFICLDPMGSTNYGKLTNVSIQPTPSLAALASVALALPKNTAGEPIYLPVPNPQTSGYCTAQAFDFIVTAVNNNIIRISGGALGFPVL